MKKEKSFTVIELLFVMAIIGFVASFTVIMVGRTREKARITGLIQFSASIKRTFFIDIVGEWEFENNLNDSSGNNLNGLWRPSTGSYIENDASPQFGKAAKLDGNFIQITDPGNNSVLDIKEKITIESWMKINEFGSKPWICVVCKDGAYQLRIRKNGQVSFSLYGEDNSLNTIEPGEEIFKLVTGKWHHLVGTWNGYELKLFINGEEKGDSVIFSGKIKDNNEDLKLGKDAIGAIDSVRLYNAGLTSAKIKTFYAKGIEKIIKE